MIDKKWYPVKGHEGRYECNKDGMVRSVDHYVYYTRHGKDIKVFYEGRLLLSSVRRAGYIPIVTLNRKGEKRTVTRAAHVIAKTFLGECPRFYHVAYRNKHAVDTRLENIYYKPDKISKADIYRIKHLKDWISYDQIMELYNITEEKLKEIINMEGYEWK